MSIKTALIYQVIVRFIMQIRQNKWLTFMTNFILVERDVFNDLSHSESKPINVLMNILKSDFQ